MNTLEINRILTKNPITSQKYLGCFASDQIPVCNFFPYCMVLNLDPSSFKGSHWVSIYCNQPNQIEYYDPLGVWPPASFHISNYLTTFAEIRFNKIALQSSSARSCGRHAIFFLHHRCGGVPFEKIVAFLHSATKNSPDYIVNDFIRKVLFNH